MLQDKIVELYRGELWECQLLESLLKDAGIDCFLANSVHNGYVPIIVSVQQVQVMIKESDFDRAFQLLKEFERNLA